MTQHSDFESNIAILNVGMFVKYIPNIFDSVNSA